MGGAGRGEVCVHGQQGGGYEHSLVFRGETPCFQVLLQGAWGRGAPASEWGNRLSGYAVRNVCFHKTLALCGLN